MISIVFFVFVLVDVAHMISARRAREAVRRRSALRASTRGRTRRVKAPQVRTESGEDDPAAARCGAGGAAAVCLLVLTYLWIDYGHRIDRRLGGEQRPVPRIFGRPFELAARLRASSQAQLVQRLNDVGYAQRPKRRLRPASSASRGTSVLVMPRRGRDRSSRGRPRRVSRARTRRSSRKLTVGGGEAGRARSRSKRRCSPRSRRASGAGTFRSRAFRGTSIDAVLAIEDRRFYDHPGRRSDRHRPARSSRTLRGDKPYLVGGSTLTQQIVKNTFLTPAQTLRRKLQEQFMALVLESRFTKDQILELYLNDVVLGQRGPFEIHGVPEAARMFFGKDVRNVTLAEAATIAGHHPDAVAPLAVPQSGARPGAPQRRARRRWPRPASSRRTTPRRPRSEPLVVVEPRVRKRGARTSSTT